MYSLRAFFYPKSFTKLSVQRLSVIAYDVQAAALRRSFRPKDAHDHIAAWSHRVEHRSDVSLALCHLGQEMKYGAIMQTSKDCGGRET